MLARKFAPKIFGLFVRLKQIKKNWVEGFSEKTSTPIFFICLHFIGAGGDENLKLFAMVILGLFLHAFLSSAGLFQNQFFKKCHQSIKPFEYNWACKPCSAISSESDCISNCKGTFVHELLVNHLVKLAQEKVWLGEQEQGLPWLRICWN